MKISGWTIYTQEKEILNNCKGYEQQEYEARSLRNVGNCYKSKRHHISRYLNVNSKLFAVTTAKIALKSVHLPLRLNKNAQWRASIVLSNMVICLIQSVYLLTLR